MIKPSSFTNEGKDGKTSGDGEYVDELIFDNGAVYKGYMKDGMRHGQG